jgi:hypothetical protein
MPSGTRSHDVEQLTEIIRLRFEHLREVFELRDGQTALLQKLMDERLRDMNNLRSENREMQKEMVSKDEYNSRHQRVVEQMENVWKFIYIGLGAGVIIQMLIGALILYFLRKGQ